MTGLGPIEWAFIAAGICALLAGLEWLAVRLYRDPPEAGRNTMVMNGTAYRRTCWACVWIEHPPGQGFEVRPCPKHAKWRP